MGRSTLQWPLELVRVAAPERLPDFESAVSPNLKSGMMKICVLETKDLWQTFFFSAGGKECRISGFWACETATCGKENGDAAASDVRASSHLIFCPSLPYLEWNDEEVGAYNRRE